MDLLGSNRSACAHRSGDHPCCICFQPVLRQSLHSQIQPFDTNSHQMGWGASFAFFSISWSLVWVPLVTWGVPRIPANYRPNIIVLVFECFSWFWWLLTFIGLASLAAYGTTLQSVNDSFSYPYRRSTTVSPNSSSSTYSTSTGGYSSASSSVNDAIDEVLSKFNGAINATKAATAFAAINW